MTVRSDDESLTARGLRHALDRTTDLAERELKVPLHYYSDPKITEKNPGAQITKKELDRIMGERARNKEAAAALFRLKKPAAPAPQKTEPPKA